MAYKDYDSDDGKSEWNSNKEVIVRMANTIKILNEAKRVGNTTVAISCLREYYLDFCGLLKEEEREIGAEIMSLKKVDNPDIKGVGLSVGAVLYKIDQIDERLRIMAHQHGLGVSEREDLSGL
jgi:hypothetical protein|tara:strand:+ start:318 stop:686 length:369 start_codon:yes stop_codon:yes gene_type:complete